MKSTLQATISIMGHVTIRDYGALGSLLTLNGPTWAIDAADDELTQCGELRSVEDGERFLATRVDFSTNSNNEANDTKREVFND